MLKATSLLAVISLFAVLLVGCAPHYAHYEFYLDEIREPLDGVEVFSAVEIGQSKKTCKNNLFTASWSFSWTSVGVELRNDSEETIYVDWDEAVFVDTDGNCHHVVPSDIRYMDHYNAVKPAKIPAGCSVNTRVIPRDNIRFGALGWTELPFLPKDSRENYEDFRSTVAGYIGRKVEVLLPIAASGEFYEYRFIFDIAEARVYRGHGGQNSKAANVNRF